MFRTAYREIGLFGLVKRTVNEFLEDDMPTYASALAYQMLFSLFPFLLVLITLVGYLHLPEFFARLREQAALLLPPEAMDQVNPVIDQLQQQKGGLLSIGIAVALWTSSAGIRSMMIALNAAYDVKESRPVWKRFSLSILYTLGIALLLLVAAGLMVTGPQVIAWIAGLVGLEQYRDALDPAALASCGVPADARGGAVLLPRCRMSSSVSASSLQARCSR